jgi:hypothetical protein
MNKTNGSTKAGVSNRFRLLNFNELVRIGDFVKDGHRGFERWEGLSGFRADAFVKPIYRQTKSVRPQSEK